MAGVVDVSPERFEELVADALDDIPEALGRYMDNVAVFVEDQRYPGCSGCTRACRSRAGPPTASPTTACRCPTASPSSGCPICRMCATEAEVVRQVGITVVHEVAHHFGIDDDRLTELGWG